MTMEIDKGMGMNMERARVEVDRICKEKGWDIKKISDFNKILGEIDKQHDKRRYKCPICKDSGIVTWTDPDDGMFYGRKCGYCRYWDEQKEKARGEAQGKK